MKTQLFAAALVVAAGLAGAAFGGPLDPDPGAPGGHGPVKALVIVSSRGLDLTTSAGADQFLGRLAAAVNRACDDRPADGPPRMMARTAGFNRCRDQALEASMTYVRSPIVKHRYAATQIQEGLRLARR